MSTPACKCFFNFSIEEYLPLCELTKIVFYALENLVYLRNIHLCHVFFIFFFIEEYLSLYELAKMASTKSIYTSVEGFFNFLWRDIFLCASWLKIYFWPWKCYLPEEFTPLCECLSIFSLKIIYLFASLQRRCFLHEEYTPLLNVFTFVFIDEY